MEYSIIHNGQAYDLPPYSLKIAEKLEKTELSNGSGKRFKEKCKGMYDLICELLTPDSTKEILGEFLDADPNTINIVYLEIVKQYNKPLDDYRAEKTNESLSDRNIQKLTDMLNAFEKVQNLKLDDRFKG